MRVALGKIILSRPDLILLDEPTNHIDLETVEFMEAFLRAQDVAMVIVSHDRYFLNQVCNRIVEIADGESKTYFGNYVEYLEARDGSFYHQWKAYNLHRDRVLALKKKIKKLQQRFLMDVVAKKKQESGNAVVSKSSLMQGSELSGRLVCTAKSNVYQALHAWPNTRLL